LQNERTPIPTDVKLRFISNLVAAGLSEIEVSSFVSPKWVPQLADADALLPQLALGPTYWSLIPNAKGMERAQAAGVRNVAVFTAASDAFTRKNTNMSLEDSLEACAEIVRLAFDIRESRVRAYVSTAFECPFAGRISSAEVAKVVESLLAMDVDEISLGDTLGVAVPAEVRRLTKDLASILPMAKWTYHFHDTRGTAIANVAEAMEAGVSSFDASAAGLGGCPYAPGAGGNLATDDLVYFLARSGVPSGVDPHALARASLEVLETLDRAPVAKAQLALLAAGPSCPI
jgi:hydroxymethylglutaryl-CoA lyase